MTLHTTGSAFGHEFGRQGFGSMRLGHATPADDHDRDPVAVINAVLDAGVTMVDTADVYQNEELVGGVIRNRRDEVLVATKFGLIWREDVDRGFDVGADPGYVRQACDASLIRLGVDVIDLYYLHHRSDTVPIEETVGAMAGLVEDGKVRALGLSNVTGDDVRRAHAVSAIAALQEPWSLAQRVIESSLLAAAAETGTVVVAHSPSGHGVLHGTQEDPDSDVADDLRGALREIAFAHDVTPGQVAIAWTHHREQVHGVPVVPLPGTTRVSHALANLAAADLRLTGNELARLDAVSTPRSLGDR